ncbi:MAG TPA: hypothetical protein VGP72_08500 [Planctomycetota bacterium]|jgi:hypothetical protein
MSTRLCAATIILLLISSARASDADNADDTYKQGLAKLREAQTDHAALVPAVKLLAKAAALFEKVGAEPKVTEINSCLYWAKKRMTLADTKLLEEPEAVKKLDEVIKPLAGTDAKTMLEKAEAFAAKAEPLLAAVRLFEVADRFPDSTEGKKAMGLCLTAMAKIGSEQLAVYKPATTDGRAFIQSEPPGAAILVVADDGAKDTGKRTPSLIDLPKGAQTIELRLKGWKPVRQALQIGETVIKPERIVLSAPTTQIDVLYEPGWTVFVDGKFAKASGSRNAETPCTVELPLGSHELGLAKEGFLDIKQRFETIEGGVKGSGGTFSNSLEIKARPSKGTSVLANIALKDKIVGKWKSAQYGPWTISFNPEKNEFILYSEGVRISSTASKIIDANTVVFRWVHNDIMVMTFENEKPYVSCYQPAQKLEVPQDVQCGWKQVFQRP